MTSAPRSLLARRSFLKIAATIAAGGIVPALDAGRAFALARAGRGPYGPLQPPDANGIMLPRGFAARVVARGGQIVEGTAYAWHTASDGGACVAVADGGWIYVSNSERATPSGGVSALRFDAAGTIVGAYAICAGTDRNCAGGLTPWDTWLTCEEVAGGLVWECDPTGVQAAVVRPALGTFHHEAAAVHAKGRHLYLTEDQPDGRFYRFTSTAWPDLSAGLLEVAVVTGTEVTWVAVPNVNPVPGTDTPTRLQVPISTAFNGGEGIVVSGPHVFFSTKGDNSIWRYHTRTSRLKPVYRAESDPVMRLSGVDNVTVGGARDLLVAEDGGNMELVIITAAGIVAPLLQVLDQDHSELAGPAYNPAGTRLYFASQRGGADGGGIVYEVRGPFRRTRA